MPVSLERARELSRRMARTPCANCGRLGIRWRRRRLCPRCHSDPTIRCRWPYTGCLAGLNGPDGLPPRFLLAPPGQQTSNLLRRAPPCHDDPRR
jgi:hypothetical protein